MSALGDRKLVKVRLWWSCGIWLSLIVSTTRLDQYNMVENDNDVDYEDKK